MEGNLFHSIDHASEALKVLRLARRGKIVTPRDNLQNKSDPPQSPRETPHNLPLTRHKHVSILPRRQL
jgi:hypothetical protein